MAINDKVDVTNLTNVPETMLVPLFFKARETEGKGVPKGEKSIIKDVKAVEITDRITYDFSRMEDDWKTQTGIAVRTYLFDEILKMVSAKLAEQFVIVNLGAGLDTRQERFPNIKWYQLDVPEAIALRKQFFNNRNTTLIDKSVLDFSWINDIKEKGNVLFIAEGLFMYFTAEEVKTVLTNISRHFIHSYITFDAIHKSAVGKKHKSVDTSKAPFKWGITSLKEVIDWGTGWRQYKVFFPPDYFTKRWRWMRFLGLIPSFRNGYTIALLETEE